MDTADAITTLPPPGFANVRGRVVDLTCDAITPGDLCAVVDLATGLLDLQVVHATGRRLVTTPAGLVLLLGPVVDD